jgi:hypothetical protein
VTRYASRGARANPSHLEDGLQARRFAYADPPYPGLAHYYVGHPDYAGEVDHAELLARLATYDGWALSTSARALPQVLALTVQQGLAVRVAVWVRGARPHTRPRHPLNAWEPVIYVPVARGSGRDTSRGDEVSRVDERRVDVLTHGMSPMLTLPSRVVGAKPAAFCRWMFDLIGATPADTFDDLYPGSGMVARTWEAFCALGGQPAPSQVLPAAGVVPGRPGPHQPPVPVATVCAAFPSQSIGGTP